MLPLVQHLAAHADQVGGRAVDRTEQRAAGRRALLVEGKQSEIAVTHRTPPPLSASVAHARLDCMSGAEPSISRGCIGLFEHSRRDYRGRLPLLRRIVTEGNLAKVNERPALPAARPDPRAQIFARVRLGA